jgi:hypothetical protein
MELLVAKRGFHGMARDVHPKRFTLVLAAALALAVLVLGGVYITQKVKHSAQPGAVSGFNPSQGSTS